MALLNKQAPGVQAEPAWLSVVGINEDGVDALSEKAKAQISSAALVMGGVRHLKLAKELIKGETLAWPSPIHDAIPEMMKWRPQSVCVLVTGDPFFYGMGAILTNYIPLSEIQIFPATSIDSLVAMRLGWALHETQIIGINGRPLERIIPHLQPGAHLIALCADETTPPQLATLLNERGFGDATMTLLEQLGGENERIRTTKVSAFSLKDIARLNCVAIEIPFNANACVKALPLTSGLEDGWFEHDGQMTKQEIRAITLSALAPRRGELLWDIGLGAGSVAIEWLLADSANRAIGIEKNPERAARARRNSQKLGVPNLSIIEGAAPAVLQGLTAPDAIFIGGGGTNDGVIEAALVALKPGGRLVMNAIALETEAVLTAAHKHYGGNLIRIGIERAESLGTMTGLRPAMRVTQWSYIK